MLAVGLPLGINGKRGAEPPSPVSSLPLPLLLPCSIAGSDAHGSCEEALSRREGESSPRGAWLTAAQEGARSPRKHTTTPAVAPRSCGGASSRGGSHPGHGSPVDEVRRAVVAWPPRPRFHSAEVLPEFVVWLDNLAGNWLQLPRFFAGELPVAGPGGLWLQADDCCSRASWVAVETPSPGT